MEVQDTAPTYRTETCRRCKGTGEYLSYGMCYGCQGRGVQQRECGTRSLTAAEKVSLDEYRAGLAAREARAQDRAKTREARRLANEIRLANEAR